MIRHGLRILVVFVSYSRVVSQFRETQNGGNIQMYDIYSEIMPTDIKGLDELTGHNAPIFRTHNKTRKNSAIDQKQNQKPGQSKLHPAHVKKVQNVIQFIRKFPVALKYFYEEMERIKAKKEVKDDLRRMVTLLEWIPQMKKDVLKLFSKLSKNVERVDVDFWSIGANDLKINTFPSSFIDPTLF